MSHARLATFAFLTLLPVAGCRMADVDGLARREPVLPRSPLDAHAVIAEHNRNADRIERLEAQPSLTVTFDRRSYGVSGRMAMEKPRNFRLDIFHTAGEVADIGSNDEKFWFWVRDSKDKAVFYCNYDETGSTPLAAALQPDWIVEALGLRAIPDDEASDVTVTRGDEPGTLVLTHRPSRAGGETVTRKTILSESTRRIREHQIWSDKKVLLARATVDAYQELPLPEAGGTRTTVFLPKKLKLEWFREKLAMEATFDPQGTKVNLPFSAKHPEKLFVEQPRRGYPRKNLAMVEAGPRPESDRDQPPAPASANETTIRETRPAPPTGVQLGEPSPVGLDNSSRTGRDPVALSADLPALPPLGEDLVGPPIPRAPEPEYARPSSFGWKSAAGANFER